MTGSGQSSGITSLGDLRIEIRSVNGRGLQTKWRMPPSCQGFEPALTARLRAVAERGHCVISFDLERLATETEARLLDPELCRRAHAELRSIHAELGLAGDGPAISDVLQLVRLAVPVSRDRDTTRGSSELPDDVAVLFAEALDAWGQSRRKEGAATAEALRGSLSRVGALNVSAGARAPEFVETYRARLLQRIDEYMSKHGHAAEPRDVLREVAVFAERIDTAEETQRLEQHVAAARELLDRGGRVGRPLEFLLQEMLREANTLGSKSPDVDLSHLVVELKSEIDKLKEQAANIE